MRAAPILLAAAVLAAVAAASCGHAPTVNPPRYQVTDAGEVVPAPLDPDYPEANCGINNTVDCRPAPN